MKILLTLAALAAFTIPAHSLEWLSKDYMSKIWNAPGGGFYFLSEDMGDPLECEISHWPVSEPVGILECTGYGDVTEFSFEVKNDTTLIIDGYEYYRVD
jgi:hypothetical protein